jgi:hypothetical protein
LTPFRKGLVAVALVGSTLGGGALGAALVTSSATAATSTTTAPASPSASSTPAAPAANGAPSGTFHSNEDATHEQGESAAREAQENAGQYPTVP